jgi:uncharacterized protein YbbC (DUF1343 family)
MPNPVTIGLERCLEDPPDVLREGRFGLLMNQASLDRGFRYAHDLLAERFPRQLAAIFSPQHGLWGQQQANMIESPHGFEDRLRIPIYSLYSQTRRPDAEMLRGLDALVVDLQDVGTRVYTFAWTVSYCLEACAQAGIPLIVLDRPNPLGGETIEGPLLDPTFASFVGRAAMPMRHGLTLGEVTRWLNAHLHIGCEVTVVPMLGWRREMLFWQTGRTWVCPSPNLPRLEGVLLYPGCVLLEGTNLSEGRGTTTPFEVIGAPFVDPRRLIDELAPFQLPGLALRPMRFLPTFDKWQGTSCGGVYLHVTDPQIAGPYRTAVAILAAIARLCPEHFQWLPPPYEYETHKRPIDIISGSSRLREAIDCGACDSDNDLEALTAAPANWSASVASCRLY